MAIRWKLRRGYSMSFPAISLERLIKTGIYLVNHGVIPKKSVAALFVMTNGRYRRACPLMSTVDQALPITSTWLIAAPRAKHSADRVSHFS